MSRQYENIEFNVAEKGQTSVTLFFFLNKRNLKLCVNDEHKHEHKK